jgi:hypothetical protein
LSTMPFPIPFWAVLSFTNVSFFPDENSHGETRTPAPPVGAN